MGRRTELAGFRIGDRVTLCVPEDMDKGVVLGDTGTVVDFDGVSRVGVRWDEFDERKHNCSCHCEDGYGWYVRPADLSHIAPESEAFDMEDDSLMDLLGC